MLSLLPDTTIDVDKLNTIIQSEDMVVLDFFADWCGPCKKITPLLKFLSNKYSKLKNRIKN